MIGLGVVAMKPCYGGRPLHPAALRNVSAWAGYFVACGQIVAWLGRGTG